MIITCVNGENIVSKLAHLRGFNKVVNRVCSPATLTRAWCWIKA